MIVVSGPAADLDYEKLSLAVSKRRKALPDFAFRGSHLEPDSPNDDVFLS